mmetsp:Transcript_35566/g.83093  ORF Transcript_35566/g.83093 Transcript_35566/m.83093 type:complete len:234 (-) Transcript_35566:147-848(-)
MYGSFGRRCAQRLLATGRTWPGQSVKAPLATPAVQSQNQALRLLSETRPQSLSAFTSPLWRRSLHTASAGAATSPAAVTQAVCQSAPQLQAKAAVASPQAASAGAAIAEGAVEQARKSALVFEIGITYTFLHYQSIFIALMRCTFQAFRPLLILFVFGQIFKAVFFLAGAPIWFSFYSIWLFEVGYGLAQCIISFIFISFFYNNLSMARLRPTLMHYLRQQRERLAQAAKALA